MLQAGFELAQNLSSSFVESTCGAVITTTPHHYKYIKSKYSANLLVIDTGSLVYEIKTEDVYEDFLKDKNLFHFSDYPQDSTFLILLIKNLLTK